MKSTFSEIVGVKYPVIMAPMFLVTNTKMVIEALNCDITAAIPALNFRTDKELREGLSEIKNASDKPFGVNIIVNSSNLKYRKQLETCIELEVDFIITSLGNPKEVINKCKKAGIKVLCDVTDLKYASKVESLGADAVIAVNSGAGGHAGHMSQDELVPLLNRELNIPVISAGGIANVDHVNKAIDLGADGVSVGTIFIASKEADVSREYKEALVNYGAKDVILTKNISGTPLTVIETPFIRKMGNKQSLLRRLMYKYPRLKRYLKLLLLIRGLNRIKKSANRPTYKTVWVAGPVIDYINSVRPVKDIVNDLTEDLS